MPKLSPIDGFTAPLVCTFPKRNSFLLGVTPVANQAQNMDNADPFLIAKSPVPEFYVS
ncbi:hypothetical protein BCF53_102225 [Reinekea marinisedimentorum]|uniref:Uncharacterized protein n=1 Tax=Reinekea marinisedimentorum TaxID=230495 RepID=A0A4R3I9W0_9GAMM|nr:hypothetical protein BCF53_102225 [Reinekea marinisedimentorum]